jgi:guanylate kinase
MQTSLADRVVSIFMTVPNIEMLYERIKRRSDLPEEEVKHRLASAEQEIAQAGRYDYQVMSVEGDPEAVYREVERIILNHQL